VVNRERPAGALHLKALCRHAWREH
jgi:hypothetical protein